MDGTDINEYAVGYPPVILGNPIRCYNLPDAEKLAQATGGTIVYRLPPSQGWQLYRAT